MTRINDTRPQYQPTPAAPKPKRKGGITKAKLLLIGELKAYAAIEAAYLEENPVCTRPGCMKQSRFIHHICSGVAGKSASRLNTNTWLEYCDEDCHEFIERLPWEMQKMLKALRVQETIDRLRT